MDSKEFFTGIVYILIAYLLYRIFLKGEQPSSKENNYNGMTGHTYVGFWGVLITLIIMGVISILRSF